MFPYDRQDHRKHFLRHPELPETLELNGLDITRVDTTKYLGVISDENLNWDEQFKRIRSKMSLKISCHIASSPVIIMVLLKVIRDMVILFGIA